VAEKLVRWHEEDAASHAVSFERRRSRPGGRRYAALLRDSADGRVSVVRGGV
jgi:hypothetical protein